MGGLKPQSLSAICVQETDLFDGARADAVSRAPRLALRMQSTQSAIIACLCEVTVSGHLHQ